MHRPAARVSPAQAIANRKAACKGFHPPKPYSCDEFLYASTAQSGKGAAVHKVLLSENKAQGANLVGFYNANRLHYGESSTSKSAEPSLTRVPRALWQSATMMKVSRPRAVGSLLCKLAPGALGVDGHLPAEGAGSLDDLFAGCLPFPEDQVDPLPGLRVPLAPRRLVAVPGHHQQPYLTYGDREPVMVGVVLNVRHEHRTAGAVRDGDGVPPGQPRRRARQ